MPTLEWIGKAKVINHHQDVPYRILDEKYTYNSTTPSGNKIIHGDNLDALKSLLPEYEGRIKCIYIDPPYNTGNEMWIYNDNVNDPKIKKWLGEVVGKEGEDLSRHDKWLCMMYPRLRLLHQLLAEDGILFVSIDDIEVTYLRLILDEIFGKSKFIAQFIWKSRQNKDNRNVTNVSIDHEYVLCYGQKLRGSPRKMEQYSNPDNDPRGPWVSANMVGLATKEARPNLHYDLIDPNTGINYEKPLKGWRYDKNTMARLISENRIIWPNDQNGRPRKKQYLYELSTEYTGYSSIIGDKYYTRDGTKEQLNIWGETRFDFPKNSGLIQELLEQATSSDDIILDSFAGSGTTAHAVLNLNKKDGGSRKFILVEMEDYAERIRRVIDGYADIEGTGGSFTYYELGEPLLNPDHTLNETIPEEKIRSYIWHTETRSPYTPQTGNEPAYLGTHNHTAYYFHYSKTEKTTLDYQFLSTIHTLADAYLIYADTCLLSPEELSRYNITFKKIPRDITKL